MAIIKNYGLRWRRDKVEWGAGSRRGVLLGQRVGSKRSDPVDFREQIGLYILYESGFAPVYVGQAGLGNARLFSRLKEQSNGRLRDRWQYFSWFGFRDVDRNGNLLLRQKPQARVSLSYTAALDEIEGILIQALEPRLNRQGARWRETADEYVQAGLPDESYRLEDISDQLTDISRRLARLEK